MPAKDRTKRRVAPRQPRARASVDAILEATRLLLIERGFARISTNQIAARAGVNVALLYRYFAGKEAIVGALIEQVAQATGERLAAAIEAHAAAPLPAVFRTLLEIMTSTPGDPDLHRELAEHVDVTRRQAILQDTIAHSTSLFAGLLARRKRELRPGLDMEAMLFVLQHAVSKASEAAVFYRPKRLSLARLLEAQTELIARALLPVHDPIPKVRAARPKKG